MALKPWTISQTGKAHTSVPLSIYAAVIDSICELGVYLEIYEIIYRIKLDESYFLSSAHFRKERKTVLAIRVSARVADIRAKTVQQGLLSLAVYPSILSQAYFR